MGREIIQLVPATPKVRVTGAIVSTRSPHIGRDAGEVAGQPPLGVRLTTNLKQALEISDVVIDFSRADATLALLTACREARKPVLIGTTGMSSDFERHFAQAARDIPLLVAPNVTLGATVLMELVRTVARVVPHDFDIEITDTHSRDMQVAPSGTAVTLGRVAAEIRGQNIDEVAVTRDRSGRRKEGAIGFACLRAHDIFSRHDVLFAGEGEQIILGHHSSRPSIFARGALLGACWLARQPAGRYRMWDVYQEGMT
jgi:4-hydroxy-tetrahydrodipicolinate reductase